MSIRDDLKAFMDGELAVERSEEMRRAIANDPALQQEIRDMKLLSNGIAARARVPEIKGSPSVIRSFRIERIGSECR